MAGAADVPVARGRRRTAQCRCRAGQLRARRQRAGRPELPEPQSRPVDLTAVELIRQVLDEATEPVTIVATGPITNIGQLFRDEP